MIECVKKELYNLFRNKLRAFLTIGGIAIGVVSVLVISGIGDIGKVKINYQLSNMGMDSLVVVGEPSNVTGLWENDLDAIKNVENIKNAMPLMNYYTKYKILDNEEYCMTWGVNEDAQDVIELKPIYGRLLNKGDIASSARLCVVDEKIAVENYKRANIVGKKIQINTQGVSNEYEVVGVVKNGVNLLQNMLGEMIPNFVYVPYTTLREDISQNYFDQIAVKLKKNSSSDVASMKIEKVMEASRLVPCEINIENLVKQKSELNNIIGIITSILSAIGGISLIVSGLSIMNVMLISVKERTREIGIKKSIGASNTDIMAEFLIESVLITLIGGIIGAVIGICFTVISCLCVSVPVFINLKVVCLIIVFSVGIGLIFGVYPAYRAASLKPVDALRQE